MSQPLSILNTEIDIPEGDQHSLESKQAEVRVKINKIKWLGKNHEDSGVDENELPPTLVYR